MGRKRSYFFTMVSKGHGQVIAMLPQRLYLVARPIIIRNNFQESFGLYADQIRHLKGEMYKTQFKWTGNFRAQRNELIVPGQNVAF